MKFSLIQAFNLPLLWKSFNKASKVSLKIGQCLMRNSTVKPSGPGALFLPSAFTAKNISVGNWEVSAAFWAWVIQGQSMMRGMDLLPGILVSRLPKKVNTILSISQEEAVITPLVSFNSEIKFFLFFAFRKRWKNPEFSSPTDSQLSLLFWIRLRSSRW